MDDEDDLFGSRDDWRRPYHYERMERHHDAYFALGFAALAVLGLGAFLYYSQPAPQASPPSKPWVAPSTTGPCGYQAWFSIDSSGQASSFDILPGQACSWNVSVAYSQTGVGANQTTSASFSWNATSPTPTWAVPLNTSATYVSVGVVDQRGWYDAANDCQVGNATASKQECAPFAWSNAAASQPAQSDINIPNSPLWLLFPPGAIVIGTLIGWFATGRYLEPSYPGGHKAHERATRLKVHKLRRDPQAGFVPRVRCSCGGKKTALTWGMAWKSMVRHAVIFDERAGEIRRERLYGKPSSPKTDGCGVVGRPYRPG